MTGQRATTLDDFLGGALKIEQPRSGHRSGSDAVLLAAAVPAKAGQAVAELGCGVAAALLCLLTRVDGARGVGIDIDAAAIALAEANAARNGLADRACFVAADLARRVAGVKIGGFDHVLANPPYFVAGQGTGAAAPRARARAAASGDLDFWVKRAADLLRHGGMVTMILRVERLGDALTALMPRFGGIEIVPLRTGAASDRVILQARKGSKAPMVLAAEIVVQQGGRYTAAIGRVLREGVALR